MEAVWSPDPALWLLIRDEEEFRERQEIGQVRFWNKLFFLSCSTLGLDLQKRPFTLLFPPSLSSSAWVQSRVFPVSQGLGALPLLVGHQWCKWSDLRVGALSHSCLHLVLALTFSLAPKHSNNSRRNFFF